MLFFFDAYDMLHGIVFPSKIYNSRIIKLLLQIVAYN